MNDNEIIELFFTRNERALAGIKEKYGHYCFHIADNILHDKNDSEECVSDTWYNVWKAIPPKRPSCLKVYLAKIVRNLSFNRYKSRTASKRGEGEIPLVLHELDECVPSVNDIPGEASLPHLKELINSFVRALPQKEADIFIRRYFFADTPDEISLMYGLKPNHVSVILSRTRSKLKKMLEKEGYDI